MRSIYDFIIKPVGRRYDNEVKVGEHTLVTNSSIESFKHVNNIAEVIETPVAFATPIRKGDLIIIHHNVFRVFYDMKGIKKNSRSFLKDGLFFCSTDQVYLYKKADTWKSFGDRCFVAPVKNKDVLSSEKTTNLIGILKIGNSSLESSGINPGDIIGFTPNSEWEFVIDDQIMYCMKSNDIVIKYGSDRNEEEYNSRWAQGN
jgi:hypothetical protein|tara:strand:- start:2226 stop:2831 length:606 start_codon:yes stop_codon:yes gene_type:complete